MEFAQPAYRKVIMNSNAVHFFDKFAIFLSATCAIHCLLTPILIIFLPIVGSSFFADANFHLWMLYLVMPTTAIAIFLGCKKHKDKIVITLSALGLLIVTVSTIYQYSLQADSGDCVICMSGGHSISNPLVWVNILAGALLISAHVRNYKLCRANHCKH
ncbi:MAG: MerC domain-containing protein [Pontiellaceae bacterium]|nr:hypothetical protein [Kiritimatiellaceae bacterium]